MAKQKTERPRIVGFNELAAALNLGRSRAHELVQEGLPQKSRGKYDLDECLRWYIRYLQALVKKRALVGEDGEVLKNEREERLRKISAEADIMEMQLARERGQLVAIDDIEKEMSEAILATKARVLAVGARVAPDLVGETSKIMIQAVLEKAYKDALSHLEKLEPRPHEEV